MPQNATGNAPPNSCDMADELSASSSLWGFLLLGLSYRQPDRRTDRQTDRQRYCQIFACA